MECFEYDIKIFDSNRILIITIFLHKIECTLLIIYYLLFIIYYLFPADSMATNMEKLEEL